MIFSIYIKNDDANQFFTSRQNSQAWSSYLVGFENRVQAIT